MAKQDNTCGAGAAASPAQPASAPATPALLPCPFCGGRDIHVPVVKGTWVRCATCEAEGPYAETPTKAMAEWNKRAALKSTEA